MPTILPSLRLNLDILPSPDPSRPGLLLRDPYQYSSAALLIPPGLINGLRLFVGQNSLLDLQAEFAAMMDVIQAKAVAESLYSALDDAGFLQNATYLSMKSRREREFAESPKREAAFAGSAYPADKDDLAGLLSLRVGPATGTSETLAIAAPHASPEGGWAAYRTAYQSLPPSLDTNEHTFVILGTSHYGRPERFGLTRKPFITPFGETRTNVRLVNELEAQSSNAIEMEDYCHAIEHSIELQTIFLQHLYGPNIQILPILCGPFAKSIAEGGLPEQDDNVQRFLGTFGEIAAREGKKLFWILGVDMAHMGARYGDAAPAAANRDEMLEVKQRDLNRIGQLVAGDHRAYWNLIQEQHDDLKWCGSAPFYTFMKTVPQARGTLLHYHQWQIDPQSVVSFAAMRFA